MSRSDGEQAGTTELGEPPPRVVLYSKPGCHLCADARAVIAAVCAELGERYDEIDITTSSDLLGRYAEEIPVTLVDGSQHDFWRVDADRLRDVLNRPPESATAPRSE